MLELRFDRIYRRQSRRIGDIPLTARNLSMPRSATHQRRPTVQAVPGRMVDIVAAREFG